MNERTTLRLPASAALPLAFALALAGCGDLFGPDFGPPAEIRTMAGDGQTATVGERLGDSLVVKVLDSKGRAVEGAIISWSRVGESGIVWPAKDTTGADGIARTVWTLGTVVGEQALDAEVKDVSARFTATATPGSPAAMRLEQGDGQEAPVTSALPEPLVVQVLDRYDNPVPDVPITWSVTRGEGVLSGEEPVTDAGGLGRASWTLGAESGEQRVSVRAENRLVSFTAIALAGPPEELTQVAGDGQSAPVGYALPDTLQVGLRDAHGNPVSGEEVAWTVVVGGGTLEVPDPLTGPDGIARAIWTVGPEADTQRVEVSVAGQQAAFTAVVNTCDLAGPDSDGDRLADCAETGTGVYAAPWDTGTDPAVVDTDGDGISDGDEVLGTEAGLDLPALGVSPVRQDILLEYDWFVDTNDCASHSHRPSLAIVQDVSRMFERGPVQNPDGSTGINLIHDYGQGGAFTGGNLIDDADGVLSGGVFGSEYLDYKSVHFAPERLGYFHYVMLPHRYNLTSNSSGQAVINGMDLIVSLQCAVTNSSAVANTIAHELGHNLGLRHGGPENRNWKPNYSSVMNYLYQFSGVDTNCSPGGDRVLDYSHGTRPPLDETSLDERTGICGDPDGPGWDWNGDGDMLDTEVQADINVDRDGNGDGVLTVLEDYDDWANLFLDGPVAGLGLTPSPRREVTTCMDVPHTLEIR